MEWRNIGPFRGGRSDAVAGVPSKPRLYYFGGVGGGVWKTENAGESWNNITDGQLKTSSVGAIAVALSDSNVIYVGMGENDARGVAISFGDGVYKSTDAGRTWKHMGLDQTRAISRIRVHPSNPDVVYVAAQGATFGACKDRGVYRSKDGGATWTNVLFVNETSGPADLAMDPVNPRILYAAFWDHLRKPWEVRSGGPGSGIYKSTDGGDTWQKINEGLPALVGKIGIDVSAANSDRLFAIVEADPKGGLYRSDDAGKTWTLQNDTDWALNAVLVLHESLRRPKERGCGVGAERRCFQKHRRRQNIYQSCGAARRQSRFVDQSAGPGQRDRGQRWRGDCEL